MGWEAEDDEVLAGVFILIFEVVEGVLCCCLEVSEVGEDLAEGVAGETC